MKTLTALSFSVLLLSSCGHWRHHDKCGCGEKCECMKEKGDKCQCKVKKGMKDKK